MPDFRGIFSVRLQDPQNFLPTRFAGFATLLTSELGKEPYRAIRSHREQYEVIGSLMEPEGIQRKPWGALGSYRET